MKGRPSKSNIKNGLINILYKKKISYGYELFKLYERFYGKTSLRNIYYNLKKGVSLGEVVIIDVKRVIGDYSWGDEVERVYYALGPYAEVSNEQLNIKVSEVKIDLNSEFKKHLTELKNDARSGTNKEKLINRCDKLTKWVKLNFKEKDLYFKEINVIKNRLTL